MSDRQTDTNLAAKVAEVFLTAGHAFQKLGDLTLQLQAGGRADECDENKWTDKDVNSLRDALTRFAHELDCISESVVGRTTRAVRTDLKRQPIMNSSQAMPTAISSTVPTGNTIIGHGTRRPAPYPATGVPVAKRAAQVRPTQHFNGVAPQSNGIIPAAPRMRYAPAASTAGTSSLMQPKAQQGAPPVPMIQIAPNNSNPTRSSLNSPLQNTGAAITSSSPNALIVEPPAPIASLSTNSPMLSQQLRNAPPAPERYRLPR
uniref:Chromatin complexes subunit BAP18 n=1 Tax=Steinernema glaseri TaxID=37863 RepID=A0A1I7Y2W2_9BILA